MNALVTGGGGFLGGSIVRALLDRGDSVRTFSRGDYPQLRKLGVETFRGDLVDAKAVGRAVEGCDTVFHAGAKAGVWGRHAHYYGSNVAGTRNIIHACRTHGTSRLVFTSSPSVAFAGKDQEGVDESEPYPQSYLSNYPRTKAIAEQEVLAANGTGLSTVALRPHLIWGPGDTQLIPRLIDRARRGRLRIVGDGNQKVDAVYIDNAAQAHLLAADKLNAQADCAGKVYYITNGEPMAMKTLINRILGAAGLDPVTKRISLSMGYAAGAILEAVYGVLDLSAEPPLTRFVALQLATAHWYDIGAAKRDLGYQPAVSMEEGFERLTESFRGSV